MALFQFSQEAVERRATEVARQHVEEQLARERAGSARQETDKLEPAPEPASRPAESEDISLERARQLGIEAQDPWLISLELRERRAAGQNCPQNGQVRAAGPGNETEPNPSSTDIAPHKESRGTEKLSRAIMHAVQFLSEQLSDGKAHGAAGLLALAQKRGITEPTLRRARLAIGAVTEKVGNAWLWKLSD